MSTDGLPISSAIACAARAKEFSDVAAGLGVDEFGPFMVRYFLVGHALELAFKAVVIVKGTSEKGLKGLGHDLCACHVEAYQILPEGVAVLAPEDLELLRLLAPIYQAKGFEYAMPGLMSLPHQADILAMTTRVVREVGVWVNKSVARVLRNERSTAT